MKLRLTSTEGLLDKEFLTRVIKYAETVILNSDEITRRIKRMDQYLFSYVFPDKRKFSAKEIILMGLQNVRIVTDGKVATIEINPVAQVPYYPIRLVDAVNLIDYGTLDIKGTHIIHLLFSYIQENITQLRQQYEMGLF